VRILSLPLSLCWVWPAFMRLARLKHEAYRRQAPQAAQRPPGRGELAGWKAPVPAARRTAGRYAAKPAGKVSPVNAPFSRLPRFSPPPLPSQFAPTLPMEALGGVAPGDEDWHDTRPQAVAADDLPGPDTGRPKGDYQRAQPEGAPVSQHAPLPVADAPHSDFHEPMGGLHMRELESPELFEHLFGPAAAA
jgi:hypothetical protein